jgi:uncharacterized membrane protein YfcA
MLEAELSSFDITMLMVIAGTFVLSGVVKGFLGIGLPTAALGILTLLMSPTEAISLLIMPIIFTNAVQFYRASNRLETARKYKYFGLTIMLSIFVTSLFITSYPPGLLTVAIGTAMVVFSANLLFGLSLPVGPGLNWQIGVGVVSGILGGLSSIWSPPVAMYLMARNTPKDEFIGAAGFLFLCGCFPLAAGLFLSGVVTAETTVKSTFALIVALVGFRIGEIMRNRLSQKNFRTIILVAFLIMGGRLIAVGLF